MIAFKKFFASTIIIVLVIVLPFQLVQAYDNIQYGFSITPPTDWYLMNDNYATFAASFTDPNNTAQINIFTENTTLSLQDYVELGKQNLEIVFKNMSYSLLSERASNIGNLNCYELVYSVVVSPELGDSGIMQTKSVILVENQKAFVIHYETLQINYFVYSLEAEQSIKSFYLLDVPGTTSSLTPSPSVPEFPSFVVVAILISSVLCGAIIYKKKFKK